MKNLLEYKGYHTKVEFDAEIGLLYGKVEGIADLVNFECNSLSEVEREFHAAVDDYLEFCEEIGKSPEKEYRGTFNVRISPDLHRKIAMIAFRTDNSLNSEVEKAIGEYVEKKSREQLLAAAERNMSETITQIPCPEMKNSKENRIVNFPGGPHLKYQERIMN